jgi:hypothetical protein
MSAAVGSVLGPERRLELNQFDIDAWNLLVRENQVKINLITYFNPCFRHGPLMLLGSFTKNWLHNFRMPANTGRFTLSMNFDPRILKMLKP